MIRQFNAQNNGMDSNKLLRLYLPLQHWQWQHITGSCLKSVTNLRMENYVVQKALYRAANASDFIVKLPILW